MDVRRAKYRLEKREAERAVVIKQAEDSPCIALVPVCITPHAAAIGGQRLATETFSINSDSRDNTTVRHSAHCIVVLGVFRGIEEFRPEGLSAHAHGDS